MMAKILITGLLLFTSFNLHAAIYKWVDEQGNTHYSQNKPASATKTERIKVSSERPEDTSSYKKPSLNKPEEADPAAEGEETADSTPQTEEEKQKQAEQEAAKKAAEEKPKISKKKKKAGCESARRNLSTMQSRGQIRTKDKDGNYRYMSDAEKQARIKRTQDIIKKNCN